MPDEPTNAPEPTGGNGSPAPAAVPAVPAAPTPPIPALPAAKKYRASIHTGPGAILPAGFVDGIQALEKVMGRPVWLLVQNERPEPGKPYANLGQEVFDGFFGHRHDLKAGGGPIALVIDSPGGWAVDAYKLAKLLRNHAGGFIAVVPQYAKSAATLLTLGADSIILSNDGALGPLDAQYEDPDREERASALNEVQALQRLHIDALQAVDSTLWFLHDRTGKKVGTVLPVATAFIAEMMRPLLAKLDTVHFCQMQRMLSVAEDYAVRLLDRRYGRQRAKEIAEHLVTAYPEHGFHIDPEEAASFGLETIPPSADEFAVLDSLMPYLNTVTAIGRLEEATP